MLTIELPELEVFDDKTSRFLTIPPKKLQLEHSLSSLSKWESIHKKAFLGRDEKTPAEIQNYILCMSLGEDSEKSDVGRLTKEDFETIRLYIAGPNTATTFREMPGEPRSREIVTSELIYYWMTVHNIPFECDRWNLDRLLALIRVCNIKSQPPKKMSRSAMLARNRSLNSQRIASMGGRG